MQPNEEKLMYLTKCSPTYAKELQEHYKFVSSHNYSSVGYEFLANQIQENEIGLIPSKHTLARFILDPYFNGKVELREYIYEDEPSPSDLVLVVQYKDYGVEPLPLESGRELGLRETSSELVRWVMLPRPKRENKTPLKDSGNRSDLGGTGGLRDINPENGRCDLLPAHILAQYVLHSNMMSEMLEAKVRLNLGNALGKLLGYLDTLNRTRLYEALDSLIQQNYLVNADVCGDEEKNWQGVYKLRGLAQMCMDLSVHYKNGALKYAERNWEKGLPVHSFIDSAIRHLCKEILGWTDEPHLIACVWNIVGALYTLETYPHLLDLPNQAQKRGE